MSTEPGDRALLTDGTGAVVRRLGQRDHDDVADLHRAMPLGDRYLRFFTASPLDADRVADAVLDERAVAFGAFRNDRLLGVAHYARSRREPHPRSDPDPDPDPELAIAVAHAEQHRGVASLLLEHLLAHAAADGVTRLRADALTRNHDVLRVLADSGIPLDRRVAGDVVTIGLDVRGTAREPYIHAVLEREATADVASLRPLLEPRSVAVVAADLGPGSLGQRVLHAVVAGGFPGPVSAVAPRAASVDGIPCHSRIEDLPATVNLAVVCVPAAALPDVVERCGRQGIRAVLGIAPDTAEADPEPLTAALARHGVRMAGPTGFGLLNTDPGVRLRATPGRSARPGVVGLAVASDGIAFALTAELDRLGLGTSTAVATGAGLDVDGGDMLMWWTADSRTRAAVVQERRLRQPRQSARLARRLARRMPVLALLATEQGEAEPRGSGGQAAHILLAASGVIAVDDIGEVPGLLAVLCRQPAPRGRGVAVLSAVPHGGAVAVDACRRHGLQVGPLGRQPGTRWGCHPGYWSGTPSSFRRPRRRPPSAPPSTSSSPTRASTRSLC